LREVGISLLTISFSFSFIYNNRYIIIYNINNNIYNNARARDAVFLKHR